MPHLFADGQEVGLGAIIGAVSMAVLAIIAAVAKAYSDIIAKKKELELREIEARHKLETENETGEHKRHLEVSDVVGNELRGVIELQRKDMEEHKEQNKREIQSCRQEIAEFRSKAQKCEDEHQVTKMQLAVALSNQQRYADKLSVLKAMLQEKGFQFPDWWENGPGKITPPPVERRKQDKGRTPDRRKPDDA